MAHLKRHHILRLIPTLILILTQLTPKPNNTSSKQQAQASALMSPILSANTTTSNSYLHFPSIHHQTSHPPPLSTTRTPPMTPQTTQPPFPIVAPTPLPPSSPNPPSIALLYPPASTLTVFPPQANQLRFQCMGCHRDLTKTHSAYPSLVSHTSPNSSSPHTSPPSLLKPLPPSPSPLHAAHGGTQAHAPGAATAMPC
nr:hypothetical transcript [Hymenolepis microstoma]